MYIIQVKFREMILLNRTTKRHPSPLGDFTTHRWSVNALWSIDRRSIEESPTLHRGKPDAPLCIFGTPKGQSLMPVVSLRIIIFRKQWKAAQPKPTASVLRNFRNLNTVYIIGISIVLLR